MKKTKGSKAVQLVKKVKQIAPTQQLCTNIAAEGIEIKLDVQWSHNLIGKIILVGI